MLEPIGLEDRDVIEQRCRAVALPGRIEVESILADPVYV